MRHRARAPYAARRVAARSRLGAIRHAGPVFTPSMVRLLAVSFGSLASLYLLLPVVPLYVATSGAGDVGAGSATGVMMLSTVLAELAVPRLLARHGYRAALVLGPLLLGGGAAATAASPGLGLVLAACAARGAGLAVVVVAGPVLAAELAPPERQGEALGLYGMAVGLPAAHASDASWSRLPVRSVAPASGGAPVSVRLEVVSERCGRPDRGTASHAPRRDSGGRWRTVKTSTGSWASTAKWSASSADGRTGERLLMLRGEVLVGCGAP